MKPLDGYLHTFRRWQRLQDGWIAFQRTAWIPSFMALLIQIVGHLFPVPYLLTWSLMPFLTWLILIWGIAWLRPFSLLTAALRTDHAANLKERLSTAFSYQTIQPSLEQRGLILLQYQDALRKVERIDPVRIFPLSWLRRPTLKAAGLAALVILSAALPNRMEAILIERQIVKDSAQEQAEIIERSADVLRQSQQLSPIERDQLARELDQLAEQLRLNPGDLEEALADLTRFDERLSSDLDPSIDLQTAYLEQLGNQLARMNASQSSSDSLASIQSDLERVKSQLETMSEDEKELLTRQLAQLSAQAAQAGISGLRQSLSALAHAVQNGDAESISGAFTNLERDLQSLELQISDQQALQAALSVSQSAQNALAGAARQLAQSSNSTESQTAGTLPGNAPGNQPSGSQPGSQSGSPGSGSVSSGGGSKANTLPPASGGVSQPPSPQGQAAQAQQGDLNRQVYAPWQRFESQNNELFIPGQDSNQGETSQSQGQNTQPGLLNPA